MGGLALTIFFILSACTQVIQAASPLSILKAWRYSDLRAISSVDGIDPLQAMIALYTRRIPDGLQLRLDMLDEVAENSTDIFVAMDNTSGGTSILPWGQRSENAWDTFIIIPALGEIQVLDAHLQSRPGISVIVLRNPSQDTISISITQARKAGFNSNAQGFYVSPGTRIQAFSAPTRASNPVASLGPVSIQGYPPPQAPVLFAFWDTLPAYTPAQSIRRWDGAHTGPQGGRHGLRNLLKASRDYSIPLTLLDLKSPTSLSALDFLDSTGIIKKMTSQGLLVLPDVISSNLGEPLPSLPDWALRSSAADSRLVGLDFGLPASQFSFASQGIGLSGGYPLTFTLIDNSKPGIKFPLQAHLFHGPAGMVLPIPSGVTMTQATLDGPSLEVRKALVETALSANRDGNLGESPILVLGGDLPLTSWGIPQVSGATLSYLSAHPWIRMIDSNQLLSARAYTSFPSLDQPANSPQELDLLNRIQQFSYNRPGSNSTLGEEARQALLALYSPVSPMPVGLAKLRNGYFGQIGPLLQATRWSAQPSKVSNCSQDLDLDGEAECVLASRDVFMVFDNYTGALTYAFVHSADGFHQIIAPSSQFITGLSDPSTWQLDRGLSADPNTIPGAFSNPGPFQISTGPDQLMFYNTEISKTYRLEPGSIQISLHSKTPLPAQIPMAIDPWERFKPGWSDRYQGSVIGGSWNWGLESGFRMQVSGIPNQSSIRSFTDSQKLINGYEDPNIDYPPGHYLPFPLAVIDIIPEKETDVRITWTP